MYVSRRIRQSLCMYVCFDDGTRMTVHVSMYVSRVTQNEMVPAVLVTRYGDVIEILLLYIYIYIIPLFNYEL